MANLATSSDLELTTLIDEASGNVTYLAKGKINSSESAAVWQIKKIEKTSSVTRIQYADGNRRFDNVWDDRASLSYS